MYVARLPHLNIKLDILVCDGNIPLGGGRWGHATQLCFLTLRFGLGFIIFCRRSSIQSRCSLPQASTSNAASKPKLAFP